ncbi:TonB-dependent receptor [Burkholderia sp. MSh2]|uniref:TonB-dependent receptor n=1 Tax=Burkholderia paludis TaxID=1506587 RepID=A0A6J5ENA4_9BURK|nr:MULTISPECIES: TonB-dependent siderophore receptor [Burkholderia]KEZ03788.1 TonB-dependent receptor [Burkholderia sp. MSh2]CAB3766961.1 putative TonB-dependent receptor BfrD [Burkholderia paludis]VWB68231.1 TonB-dependent receptor [Burkholderia paludis]
MTRSILSSATPPRRATTSVAFAMMTCASVPAGAEEAEPSRQAPHLNPIVVQGDRDAGSRVDSSGSAKYAIPLLDVPQTITVVPRTVLDEQQATSLREALANVAGITFNAGEGGGGSGDLFNIRGFGANANLQLDGLRDSAQNNRSDLFNLEAVEVIKGPNSVFGGAGTTGGSVNLISKTPKAGAFVEAGTVLGTSGYRRVTLDANRPLPGSDGKAVFRLNAMAHVNDVPGRDDIRKRRWGVAPSVAFGLGTPTRVTLGYFHQYDNNLPDYGLPARDGQVLGGVARDSYFGWRNLDRERIESDTFTVKAEHDVSPGLKLQNLSRYAHLHRDTVISASHVNLDGLPPGRYKPAGPQGYGRDSSTSMWANQTNVTSEFGTFGVGHTLVAGFELSRETYGRTTYSYGLARYFPADGYALSAPPGYWAGPAQRQDSGRNDTALDVKALYAFDTISFGEHWDLDVGLRHDWIDGWSRSTPAGKPTERADSTDRHFSTRAGLVFKPTANDRVYVAYGTSFNPSAEFLVTTGSGVSAETGGLAPEKNESVELGAKWEGLAGLALNAALFQTQKNNARERMADGSYQMAGKQRVRGFELGAAGKVTPGWDVFANYTYLASVTLRSPSSPRRDGQALGNTPRHAFNLWTTYRLPAGWTIGYGSHFVGRRNVTSEGNGTLGAYWVHNLMASYEVSRRLRFQLNVDNLFDRAYVERVRQQAGSASRSSAVELGDGRSAMLSAVYRF